MKYFLLLFLFLPLFFFYEQNYTEADILENPSLIEYQYAASTKECLPTYIAFNQVNKDNQHFNDTLEAFSYLKSISPRNEVFITRDKKAIVISSGIYPFYFYSSKEDCLSSISYIQSKF